MDDLKNFFELDCNSSYKIIPNITFSKLKISTKSVYEMNCYSKNIKFFEFLETEPHSDLDETKDYMKSLVLREQNGSHGGDSLYWGITDANSNELIGTIGLVGIKENYESACTTMGLSMDYRNGGKAIEATLSLLYYSFYVLNINKIWALTMEDNLAVIKLHELFGFNIKEIKEDYYEKRGEKINAYLLTCPKKSFTYNKAVVAIKFLDKLK